MAGESAELGALLEDLAHSPIESVGALKIDAFLPNVRLLAATLRTHPPRTLD